MENELKNTIDKTIEEKIKLTIEQDNRDNSIKEKTVILNTGVQAFVTSTLKIKGILESVIISLNKTGTVKITFADKPGIVLFDERSIAGDLYLHLRKAAVGITSKDIFEEGAEKWVLNDTLRISLEGNLNSTAKVTFRFK